MQQGLPRRLRHFVSLFPRLAGRGKVGYPKSIAGWSAKRWRLVAYLVVFACPDLPSAARCRPRDRSARDPRWVRRAPVPGNTHFSRHLRQCWWCEPEHLRRGIIDSLTFGPATRCGNPAGMKFAVSFLGCSGDVIPDLTQWASRGSSAGTNKPSFFHQEPPRTNRWVTGRPPSDALCSSTRSATLDFEMPLVGSLKFRLRVQLTG